jgi:hypothetical protein
MYSSAAGWLMVTLTTNALMVSFVQVAATLPMFLRALLQIGDARIAYRDIGDGFQRRFDMSRSPRGIAFFREDDLLPRDW